MTEFFRHFRPLKFDRTRVTVTPLRNGGVSYLLRPSDVGTYDFWLYICPLDAEFSSKVAVKKLREVANSGVAPWGSIAVDSNYPLVDLLVSATQQTDLPTEVGAMVKRIWLNNHQQNVLREASIKKNTLELYQETQ